MYEIEKGVQIPDSRWQRGRPRKYPFSEMEVGDSFVVQPTERKPAITSADQWAKYHKNGAKFVSRFVDGVVRIWRVE